jgi:hypothetical protein
MKWTHCCALFLVAIFAASCTTFYANAKKPDDNPGKAARSADSFVDSICIATHWSYTDTPYHQRYAEVKRKLIDSGIRNIRDSLYRDRAQDLGKRGIRFTVAADVPNYQNGDEKTVEKIVAQIKSANAAGAKIDAVEGPNEPDLFWSEKRFKKKYKGQSFPAGVIAFQKDLYAAVKRDRATAKLKVIGPSLAETYDPGAGKPNPFATGSLSNVVDWGNFHPYPTGGNPFSEPFSYNTTSKYYWHSDFPSINLEEFPYAFKVYSPPFKGKPMAATETGYSTFRRGVSEKVHAKYMPRLFLEYFRKDVQRTCAYEFVDEFANAKKDNREAHFGLLRRDLSPKPAYTAVQNLIKLLQDPGAPFTPGKLSYKLAVAPVKEYREPKSKKLANYDRTQYMHHLLLQKRDGSFYLALWHEISSYDQSADPPREIQPPDLPVTLTLQQPIRKTTLYTLNDNGSLASRSMELNKNQLKFNVPDRVIILKLEPGKRP